MQIGDKTVVAFEYVLRDDNGQVLDSSEGKTPLTYLHGAGRIIPGLERELEGKKVGDEFRVSITPSDGYGERNEELRQEVARSQFEGIEDIQPGMQFRVDTNAGPMVFTIVAVHNDMVTIDGNHPLAGLNLNFDVKVQEVREATEEELAQGHAHHDHPE